MKPLTPELIEVRKCIVRALIFQFKDTPIDASLIIKMADAALKVYEKRKT